MPLIDEPQRMTEVQGGSPANAINLRRPRTVPCAGFAGRIGTCGRPSLRSGTHALHVYDVPGRYPMTGGGEERVRSRGAGRAGDRGSPAGLWAKALPRPGLVRSKPTDPLAPQVNGIGPWPRPGSSSEVISAATTRSSWRGIARR